MNRTISNTQTAGTYTAIAALGVTLSLVLSGASNVPSVTKYESMVGNKYSIINNSSYDSFSNRFTGELQFYPEDFQQEISALYSRLLLSQQSLGKEFEKILVENLWDLYEE
jgi:hypothetical protein